MTQFAPVEVEEDEEDNEPSESSGDEFEGR
jgi:hypothetical protein